MTHLEPEPIATISGLENPEDFCPIPGSDWVITSAMSGRGIDQARSAFINIRTHEVRPAFPENCVFAPDPARFPETEPPEHYMFHGLDVGVGADGQVICYQVNHPLDSGPHQGAGRESVEVFGIDLTADGLPVLRWLGAVIPPNYVWGNDVCVIPSGGFALTNFVAGGAANFSAAAAGHICGQLMEWTGIDTGWRVVEGTDVNAPNGVAISRDERHYFVASWGTMVLHKVSRSDPHGDRRSVDLGALLDNITWTPNGTLLVAGQGDDAEALMRQFANSDPHMIAPVQAIEVDPETLEHHFVLDANPGDRISTTALQVDGTQIWTGSSATTEIVVYAWPETLGAGPAAAETVPQFSTDGSWT